jgi:U3 small nucleolar RNA-associated protein 14
MSRVDDLYERDSDSEKGSESEESETDSESDDPTNDLDDSDENADGADSTGIEDGISQMVVGHNGRTTFALRGDRVEVYQKDDETIKRSTATKKFKYKGRDAFKPSNVSVSQMGLTGWHSYRCNRSCSMNATLRW